MSAGIPFVPARWFTPTNGRSIDLLVLHTMEAPEKGDTAEAVANYFRTTLTRASAHACVDSNSRVDCVYDDDVAYGAPKANHNGLQLEMAGYARQSEAEWLDPYSLAMIEGPAAEWVAEKSDRYGIPLVYVDAAGLLRGERGVTTHWQTTLAWHASTHTDPGVWFPVRRLLHAAAGPVLPPPDPEDDDVNRTAPDNRRADLPNSRAPYFKWLSGVSPTTVRVLGYNGAQLVKVDSAEPYGVPWFDVKGLAAPVDGIIARPDGRVVLTCEDGGTIDVAA